MHESSELEIRPAQRDIAEGRIFAAYLDVAADGMFRLLFGRDHESVVAEAFLEPSHDLSYEHVVFAELDRHIVGMASGYTAAEHERSTDAPLRSAAGWRTMRMVGIAVIAGGLIEFMDAVPDGAYYLQAITVDEQHRGAGIGSALMDHAERLATSHGCSQLLLDVAADNDAARRLYERRGMVKVAESPSVLLLPQSSVFRMAKPL